MGGRKPRWHCQVAFTSDGASESVVTYVVVAVWLCQCLRTVQWPQWWWSSCVSESWALVRHDAVWILGNLRLSGHQHVGWRCDRCCLFLICRRFHSGVFNAACVYARKSLADIVWGVMGALQNGGSATLLLCVSSLDEGRCLMRLFPNARDENLNSTENLWLGCMFRCVRPVTACLTRCNENVVHFSRCVTSFGDFQRVVFARSPHRSASLLSCSCEAQKLSRLSPSECPRTIRRRVNMVCYWQHRLWFQKVSFTAVAPLRSAVNTWFSL